MTLNQKQVLFTATLGKFLAWCAQRGYEVILAEVFRTNEQAAIYAKAGKGIKNSVHTKKLAGDMFLMKNGKITWDADDYAPLGKKWKSMHELCRWGGDFKGRDAVHFSFEHNGVR
jgi:hypothetical protein